MICSTQVKSSYFDMFFFSGGVMLHLSGGGQRIVVAMSMQCYQERLGRLWKGRTVGDGMGSGMAVEGIMVLMTGSEVPLVIYSLC